MSEHQAENTSFHADLAAHATPLLSANEIKVKFGARAILNNLSLTLPPQKITTIIGPNASGKSTLLRSLARLQPVSAGQVVLDGKSIHRQNNKAVARRLAILSQSPIAPEGLSVRDLVLRGRTPHQSPLRPHRHGDTAAVERALEQTGLKSLAGQPLSVLSGGQRQRAWIAMALAQETELLLLDEPTTYLDLTHQIELLQLVHKLNRDTGRTVVMVLHDINLAARFADHLVAIKEGEILCQGPPAEVVTPDVMQDLLGLACAVLPDPVYQTPHLIPI